MIRHLGLLGLVLAALLSVAAPAWALDPSQVLDGLRLTSDRRHDAGPLERSETGFAMTGEALTGFRERLDFIVQLRATEHDHVGEP